ncbi:MAG: LysR family transcriptional regulator [Anaerolineae bacterium]|nr:LysR family transcriptional regulator [Anaerolineae bacterium]
MELRQLKTFHVVATLQSFNKAALALNYAQSTVSEQIKSLEGNLGVRLFDRKNRRVSLTQSGEMLLQYAQKMIDIEEEARSEVTEQGESHGSLSIRIPETVSTYYLPCILKTFRERYPKVGLNFARCAFYGLQQELASGIIDLAFLLTDESFLVPDTKTETLLKLPLVIVARADHPLASRQNVDIQDLIGEPILLPSEDCSYRVALERMITGENVDPAVILNFNSIEALRRCVIAGVGITLATEIAMRDDVQSGRLAVLPWTGKQVEASLQMIWHKSKWISPILQAFMETVRESVSSLGDG